MKNLPKYVAHIFNFFYSIGSNTCQMVWISKLQNFQIVLPKSQTRNIVFQLFLATYLTHIAGVSILLYSYLPIYLEKGDYVRVTFHSFWAFGFLMCLMPHFFQGGQLHNIKELVNETVHFAHKVKTEYKGFYFTDLFKKCLRFRLFIAFAFGYQCIYATLICVIPLFIIFRKDVWHFGSIFYKIALYYFPSQEIPAIILGVIADSTHFIILWGPFLLQVYLNLLLNQSFSAVAEGLRNYNHNLNSGCSGKTTVFSFKRIFQTYSKLRVLSTVYNNVYGRWYIPQLSSVFGACFVVGAFMAIRLYQISNHVAMLFCGIGIICTSLASLGIMTLFGSMVHQNSVKLETNLKKRLIKGRYLRRLLRTYKIESVKSGSFYEIHRITTLTVVALVSNITSSLLISFQA
ncbi:unnamed protein product [Orchesella dallaii]|uniref:Gustatory receptor n=1 Tax=Orchesella dallaii TaxID=48710 RepID=A0ABP1QQ31_9HEXA